MTRYEDVGAVAVPRRNQGFDGSPNFRDIGGYIGDGGRRTRWGMVYRAGVLNLRDTDLEPYSRLGVTTIYDLRFEAERAAAPDRLPAATEVVEWVPIISGASMNSLFNGGITDGETFLAELYCEMLEESAACFGRILLGLANGSRLPAVIHCTAGKDRTGLAVALLLSALGVSRDEILDDFELTSISLRPEEITAFFDQIATERGVAPEVAAGLLRAPRHAMESALHTISERWGGIDAYLTGRASVDPAARRELRHHLLERALT